MALTTKNLGLVQALHSGVTPPQNTKILWYDINTNLHKYYDVVQQLWLPLKTGVPSEWQDSVKDILTTPPTSPNIGDRYLIGASATGDWAGKDGQIATWNGTGWGYYIPTQGATTRVDTDTDFIYFSPTDWSGVYNWAKQPVFTPSLASVLIQGNTTGGTDINISDGDSVLLSSNLNNILPSYIKWDSGDSIFYDKFGDDILTIATTNGLQISHGTSTLLFANDSISLAGTSPKLSFVSGGFIGDLLSPSFTNTQTWQLPDKSGTIALLSDITSLPTGVLGETLYHDGNTWVASTNIYNTGSLVGINTTTPTARLHIQGNTGENPLRIDTDSLNNVLSVFSDNWVGIGTTSRFSLERLRVAGAAVITYIGALGASYITNSALNIPNYTSAVSVNGLSILGQYSTGEIYLRTPNAGKAVIRQGYNNFPMVEVGTYGVNNTATTYLRIESQGTNGTNILTRGNELQVQAHRWDGSASQSKIFKFRSDALTLSIYGYNYYSWIGDDTKRMITIGGNGRVGIGDDLHSYARLHIRSNSGEDALRVDVDAQNSVFKIDSIGDIHLSGTPRQIIHNNGQNLYFGGLDRLYYRGREFQINGESYLGNSGNVSTIGHHMINSSLLNHATFYIGDVFTVYKQNNGSAGNDRIRFDFKNGELNYGKSGIDVTGDINSIVLKADGWKENLIGWWWNGSAPEKKVISRQLLVNTDGSYYYNLSNTSIDLFRLYDNGQLSIGDALAPSARLHIRSNAGEDALRVDTDGFNDVFKIYSDGKVYIRSAFGSSNYVMIGINRAKYSYENNDMLITMNTRIYNSLSLGAGVSGAGLLGLDSNWIIDWTLNSRIQQDNTNGLRLINNQASVTLEAGTGNRFMLIRRYGIQIGDIDNQANGSFPQYSRYLKFRTSYYDYDNSSTVYNSFQIKALEAGYQDSANSILPDSQLAFYANLDGDPDNQIFGLQMPSQITTANKTVMKLMIYDGTNYVLKDVEVGAADSAGTGYRTLRVTN